MKNETMLEWAQGLLTDGVNQCIAYYEIILVSLIAVIALLRGRQFWLNILSIWMFVEAVTAIFYPEIMIQTLVEGKPDAAHLELLQGLGVLLAVWCISYWLLCRSTDSTVQTSLLWAMTIQAGCAMLAFAYLITHPMKKGSPIKLNQSLVSPFFSSLIFLVVTAYFAMKSTDWGGYSENPGQANLHLKVDYVVLTIFGVMLYALPQWVIRICMDIDKLDAMHTYLGRVIAGIVISMGVMSGRAANFLRPSDKDAHMVTHWMYFVFCLFASMYDLYMKRSEVTWVRIGGQVGCDIGLVMNATGALNLDVSVFQRVCVPRVKALVRDCINWIPRKLKQN